MKTNPIRQLFLLAAPAVLLAATLQAAPKPIAPAPSNVVRPAPSFTWLGAGNRAESAKSFKGQPVVLLVAPSPNSKAFRQQVGRLDDLYLGFSAKRTVFVAAFTTQPARVQSNVPYVIAQNGAAVAAAFGVNGAGLSVVVIGPDGNVDMVSGKVEGAQRVLDIINNNYQNQAGERTGLGG